MWKKFLEHTTEIIVCFAFVMCLTFTVVVMILSIEGVETNDTLIEWFFLLFGMELIGLSGIKISKHAATAYLKARSAIEDYDYDDEYDDSETDEDDGDDEETEDDE